MARPSRLKGGPRFGWSYIDPRFSEFHILSDNEWNEFCQKSTIELNDIVSRQFVSNLLIAYIAKSYSQHNSPTAREVEAAFLRAADYFDAMASGNADANYVNNLGLNYAITYPSEPMAVVFAHLSERRSIDQRLEAGDHQGLAAEARLFAEEANKLIKFGQPSRSSSYEFEYSLFHNIASLLKAAGVEIHFGSDDAADEALVEEKYLRTCEYIVQITRARFDHEGREFKEGLGEARTRMDRFAKASAITRFRRFREAVIGDKIRRT